MIALWAKHAVAALALAGLEGSVVALFALAIAGRRQLRPAWQAAIWLVVLVRFALPWTPELPWSIADLLASVRGGDASSTVAVVGGATPAAAEASSVWILLLLAWLVPAAVLVGRGVARLRASRRHAASAEPAPQPARTELAQLAQRLGVRTPALAVGRPDLGPHVVGVFRPIIVVPPMLLSQPELLRAALLHELAHVRRRDAMARLVQLVATSLFWFWPITRAAARRLDLAREAACDAWALEAGELPGRAYARLLVAMARLQLPAPAPAGGAALAMAAHHLDARVAAVLAGPGRARLGGAHRVAIAGFALVALGGARTAHARAAALPCTYTPEIAAALYTAHPEADRDGDGVLSRDEACELQAELRRQAALNHSSPADEVSLAEPLYCNRDSEVGQIPPESSCHQGDGE
jgi:beta-lactamase regulating signal transducer with metallopeptidase domain